MSVIGNENNFNECIQEGTVLVDFFATWCGPCKMLGPVLEEIASERSEVKVVKIDVDENATLAKQYGIMSVPTMVLFQDGKQVATRMGYMPKELICSWIEENK